jgi:hypothetical protein
MSKTENIYNTTLEIIDYAVANGIIDASCGAYHCSNRIDQRKIENSKSNLFFYKLRVTVFRIALKTVTFFSINETKLAAKSLFDVLILF